MDRREMAPEYELGVERYAGVITESLPSRSNSTLFPAGDRPSDGVIAGTIERSAEGRETSHWHVSRIAIQHKRKVLFVDSSNVFSVVAQGNDVVLEAEFGSYRLLESISAIAEKLRPHGFIRIHRSRVVNCC